MGCDCLQDWTRRRRVRLAQIGVSVPGLGRLSELVNPIIPCDIGLVRGLFGEMFAGVPVEFTNSVVAHAMFHRCRTRGLSVYRARIFSSLSARALPAPGWMTRSRPMRLLPVELGHMVFGEGGPPCRCGHHGCVEAYTSLPALAGLLGVCRAGIAAARR